MATGCSESVFAVKEKIIDELEEEFHRKLKTFSSEVKTTMRAAPPENAIRCFEVALVFLTQVFPNVTDCGDCSDEDQTGARTFKDRLCALESKIEDQARTTEDELKLHGDRLKASEKKLEKSQDHQRKQLDHMQARITRHGKNLRKLNESSDSCNQSIIGLKKLQTLFNKKLTTPKTTTATAQTTVPPSTKPSSPSSPSSSQTPKTTTATAQASVLPPSATSSSSQASAAALPRGPPKSLSQKHIFSANVFGDSSTSDIFDAKLLPCGLVVLSDWNNECVKLFNTQGQHLHSQSLDGGPVSLAVMDITPVSGWDVAVSVPHKKNVFILRVSNTRLSVKTSLSTSGHYWALAAVNAQTLAVGFGGSNHGIDLINLTGQVLRRLSSDLSPCFMATTPDRCLVVSTTSKTLVKLRLVDGSKVFDHKVTQIGYPQGISCHQDGSTVVVNPTPSSLHLVSPDGRWVRNLLNCPGGFLRAVSSFQDVCVSCLFNGSFVVCDIVF